ncbi:MAG TPA: hypothetical protein VHC97_18750 [Thermoanaerobaculia bacterium]|jgi:hypothetical protein|nr:hypothetical protein [Thermoanaerobaculia bacterium]
MGKLGQLLVARGWITVQQLTRALKTQNVAGGRLGTCLLEMDALREDLLLKGLSEQLGVPAVEIDDLRGIPDEVLGLISDKLARRLRAVPFRVEGGRLDLALMDPRNLAAQDEIAFASGKRVKVYVADEIRILEALDKYYGEECPSRYGMVLDRLNRARFLWEKVAEPRPAAEPPAASFENPFAAPPRIKLPPELPMPAAPAPPAAAAIIEPPPVLTGPAPAVRMPQPPPPRPAAPAAETEPAGRPVPPSRPLTVSLTPEERAELGAFSFVEPASADRSLPVPANLEEVETELTKTSRSLDEVGQILLGFLGRNHRRAALFQVTRDRITGWKVHGPGIDREAFTAFSVGFDQPSIFLNLRQGSGLYLGPLPPMPAHRELARTWGGDLPRDCVLLPVRIKDRLVIVLYADGATKGPVEYQQMQRLVALATSAVERAILQRKHGEAKP